MKSLKTPKAAGVFNRYIYLCLALMLMLLYPLSAAADDKVRLQLKWQHQFQFAGYYAAQAQGYYQAVGLDVEIIPCQPDEDAVQKVLQGKAEFGVGSTELLLLREQGAPVVVLAVIFQHSPLVFMTLKRSGLQSIHDLVGRRVVIEPGSSELYAYLREEGISSDKFTLLPHGFNTKDLLAGNIDAMSAYVTDELFELRKAGHEYVLYSPRAAGIDFYGDNLFTTESQIKLKPKMVKAFREASLKGWEYAMEHPEELVQLIYSRYSQRHSIEHLRFEAHQMVPLLQMQLLQIGHMNPGRWQHIAEIYTKLGMRKPDFNFKGFLYDPNPAPSDLRWLYVLIGLVTLGLVIVSAIAVYIYRTNARLRQEVAERKLAEEKIRQMAYYDSMTGLPNRELFSDRLGIALIQAKRNKKEVGIAILDLDNFKNVNDTLGHAMGDLLLKATAERLTAALRKGDTVARIGGDEFVLILPDLKIVEDAIQVAQKIVDSFRKPFFIDTHQLVVTTSIGIAVYPNDGMDGDILLKNADIAMYQAKQAGRDRYQIYK